MSVRSATEIAAGLRALVGKAVVKNDAATQLAQSVWQSYVDDNLPQLIHGAVQRLNLSALQPAKEQLAVPLALPGSAPQGDASKMLSAKTQAAFKAALIDAAKQSGVTLDKVNIEPSWGGLTFDASAPTFLLDIPLAKALEAALEGKRPADPFFEQATFDRVSTFSEQKLGEAIHQAEEAAKKAASDEWAKTGTVTDKDLQVSVTLAGTNGRTPAELVTTYYALKQLCTRLGELHYEVGKFDLNPGTRAGTRIPNQTVATVELTIKKSLGA
jgi:hypothetical protein